MTKLSSSVVACGALMLGFTLGTRVTAVQSAEDKPVQVARVDHISVFVRSVEKTAELHKLLLGTEIPKFQEPARQPIFPPDFKGDRNSHPKYGTIQLQNARLELQEGVGGPGRWSEFQEKHGQGIEHLGFAVPNVAEASARFQKAGGKLIMGGCDGCTAHIDMREQLGYIVELMPMPKP